MKVLLASSEVHPFSKTGGLADMVGALGKALARRATRRASSRRCIAASASDFPKCAAWTGISICRWATGTSRRPCGRWKWKRA